MRSIDELNNKTFDEEEYFKEYFEPMDIPEEAKKEREEASEDIFDLLLFMFLLIDENLETGAFAYNDLLMEFQRRYADIIATYGRNDAYFQSYLGLVPGEILDTTIKNLDNEYYTSEERAASVSANEANSILNYEELQRKIDQGFTHKTWKAEIDNKTRLDHDEMNGTTIPIEEYFIFPDCEMLMPHDEVNGTARQVVNCRCSLRYSILDEYDKESEESNKYSKGDVESTAINRNRLNSKVLKQRLSVLNEDSDTQNEILNRTREIIGHRNKTHFEDLAFVDTKNKTSKINKEYDFYDASTGTSKCAPNEAMYKMIDDLPPKSIIGIHNHPSSTVPSVADIQKAYERQYKYGLVVCHNGDIYKYTASQDIRVAALTVERLLAKYKNALYSGDVSKALQELGKYGIDIQAIL